MNPSVKTVPVLLALAVTLNAYVGKWHSFTDKEGVHALIAHRGLVYAGTQGGIRRIHPATFEEKDYDNLDGLIDCSITGMAEDGDGTLWAVSHAGYVYSLSGETWETFGRSYAAQQWVMNDRAVLAAGRYLFLGSEKGLTVFDLAQKVSQANITRFGDLIGTSVLSLLRRADTLYIGTPQGVFKAGIDFNNPINPATDNPTVKYGNLSDPHIWIKVAASVANPSRPYNFLAFVGDTLTAFGPGMLLQGTIPVRAFDGQPAAIGGTSFAARTDLTSAILYNGKVFLGGDKGIFVCANPLDGNLGLSHVSPSSSFPRDTVWNIAARGENLWGQSPNGLYGMNPGTGDTNFFTGVYTHENIRIISPEFTYRHLTNLKAADNGDVYIGSWGAGLVRIRNGATRGWNAPAQYPCIYEISTNPDYYVVHSVSNVHGNQLYFTMLEGGDGTTHQLVFLNTETERITCLDSLVQGVYPHAVHAYSDSLVAVDSERGVVFMKIRQGFTPTRQSLGLWTVNGATNETWGLAADGTGRPWALMGNQLVYVDRDTLDSAAAHLEWPDSRRRLQVAAGFSGTDCYTLEGDPLGSLWVGCGNGLFHIRPGSSGIDKMDRYGLDDGLLSLTINDISINPSNGQVWVATDRGVSMLESASQPPVTNGLNSVQVYPNPFRPQHRFVIFDNLPRNATVRVHNAAGAIVRTFHPRELTGNQAQWDGTNEEGRPVAAGVYLYSVTSGSSVERGKIIVAR